MPMFPPNPYLCILDYSSHDLSYNTIFEDNKWNYSPTSLTVIRLQEGGIF